MDKISNMTKMDFILNIRGLCLVLSLVAYTASTQLPVKDCRLCKPGYSVSRQCTALHDTVCKPCSKGTFASSFNLLEKCSVCSKCNEGEFVLTECTRYSDTVCDSCSAVSDVISDSFAKECLQTKNDVIGVERLRKRDAMLQDDANADGNNNNAIFEGSGETVREEFNEVDVWPTVEGSGETHVEPESKENTTYVILPEGIDANVTEATTPETTTRKTGVIQIDGEITLKNVTDKGHKDIVLSKEPPTTTRRYVVLEEDKGFTIGNPPEPEDSNVNVVLGNEQKPKADASKGISGDTGGSNVGVIVTVGLAAALVFFILGFLVSRYWSKRRERTFYVQEAERRNGTSPVECKEYRDPEANGKRRAGGGDYDEIPADAKTNGRAEGRTPIYTKPLKRPQPQTAAATEQKDQPKPEQQQQQQQPRPTSDIQFIDEEHEEQETERLLPGSANDSDVSAPRSSASSSESGNGREEPDMSDESVPMLSKGGPNNAPTTSS